LSTSTARTHWLQERKYELDTPGHYEGETGLHIAIVNRDFDMVKFLIQAGADVRARCYGEFFQPGSVVHYGEYPLSFAACTGQKDIVSYLKRHGARVNHDRDTCGNTALHLCVYHDQLDMYDHLVEYCGAMEHVRNNRGMTPLLLAASLGKLEVRGIVWDASMLMEVQKAHSSMWDDWAVAGTSCYCCASPDFPATCPTPRSSSSTSTTSAARWRGRTAP
jgi:hypothetical protein